MTEQRLREPAFLVLTALAGQPRHGYAVIEEVHRISDGGVRLHAGTLYAILDRLRTTGLVEVEREEIVQSRLRRYYRITEAGAQRLAVESDRLLRNVEIVRQRLGRLRFSYAILDVLGAYRPPKHPRFTGSRAANGGGVA